jgi:hypothetical protein
MGQEANCLCAWKDAAVGAKSARVKAVLEPPELILRGEIKRRIPFAAMKQVTAEGARLRFRVEEETFCLELGEAQAQRWAQALRKPPPALAKKLGIAPGCTVRVLGAMDDEALRGALKDAHIATGAGATKADEVEVMVARVNSPAQIAGAWKKAAAPVAQGAALWMVYRKGRGLEAEVRNAGLAAGFVDVKVAAVSAELTALKFVRRKNAR